MTWLRCGPCKLPAQALSRGLGLWRFRSKLAFRELNILMTQSRQRTSKEVNMRISTGYKYSEETKCKEIRESPWGWECSG